jgi:hypothetical protein
VSIGHGDSREQDDGEVDHCGGYGIPLDLSVPSYQRKVVKDWYKQAGEGKSGNLPPGNGKTIFRDPEEESEPEGISRIPQKHKHSLASKHILPNKNTRFD